LVDVLGPRGGLTAGILYLATVLALTATVHHSWQLFLIFGVGLGIGFGLLNLNVYSAMIMQIVPESRAGTAVGIATSGSTFGQFALVPLFQHLADTYGWRTGYVIAAVATAAIAPLAWTLLTISARPTQDGGSGTAEKAKGDDGPEAGSSATDSLWVKMKRLLTNTLYWALTYAFVVCGVTTTGFVESHIIAFAEHKGMTAQDGAFAFGLLPAFNGLGILAAGWLADRYHRVYMLAAIFFVRGLCYAAMLVVSSYWQLLLFGVFFGLVDYSVVPLVISLVASYCGADVVGLGVGVLLLWHSLGAAGGSWMGGVAFDGSGHYDHAIWICLVTCVSAAAVLVLGAHGVGEPWRRRPDQDEAAASPEAAP
jgi:predicted MFS family arabinose efflux permease